MLLRQAKVDRGHSVRLSVLAMFFALSPIVFAQEKSASGAVGPVSQGLQIDTASKLSRILALTANNGTDSELSAGLAGALGYTGGDQPWPFHQIAARTDEGDTSSPLHILAIGRGAGSDLLIYTESDGVSRFIRASRDGQVEKGIAVGDSGGGATPIAIADAQEAVNAELRFWDRNEDEHVHWWACEGELAGAHPVTAEKKIEACTWLIQSGKETPRSVDAACTNSGMAYHDDKQK
jgi:hypothetical protein